MCSSDLSLISNAEQALARRAPAVTASLISATAVWRYGVLITHWQQHMRGALSQMSMASGPWIWRPMDAAETPVQKTLFEGLQS